MQLTPDVNIPSELLQAARDNELVLFVGAGVSVNSPSGLPLFNDLAAQVAVAFGETFDHVQSADRFLGELSVRHPDVKAHAASLIGTQVPNPTQLMRQSPN